MHPRIPYNHAPHAWVHAPMQELEEEALLAAVKLRSTSWAAATLMRGSHQSTPPPSEEVEVSWVGDAKLHRMGSSAP